MSVSDKIVPADILFKILVVACPTFGFIVSALTAILMNGAVALIAGSRIFFHAVFVPPNNFYGFFIEPPWST